MMSGDKKRSVAACTEHMQGDKTAAAIKSRFILEAQGELHASIVKTSVRMGENHTSCRASNSKCILYPRRLVANFSARSSQRISLADVKKLAVTRQLPWVSFYLLNDESVVMVCHKSKPASNAKAKGGPVLSVSGAELRADQLSLLASFFSDVPADMEITLTKENAIETVSSRAVFCFDLRKPRVANHTLTVSHGKIKLLL